MSNLFFYLSLNIEGIVTIYNKFYIVFGKYPTGKVGNPSIFHPSLFLDGYLTPISSLFSKPNLINICSLIIYFI